MKPFFQDELVTLFNGDALRVLQQLPSASVHMCVTSPPYWGLRDYGTQALIWDGDPSCEHAFDGVVHHEHREQGSHGKSRTTERFWGGDPSRRFHGDHQRHFTTEYCIKCHAWRGSLGLEPDPDSYVHHLIEIFREVKRVLRDDGTCWINLGDSFSSGGRVGHGTRVGYKQQTNRGMNGTGDPPRLPQPYGLKPKDLIGMPWRVAFALQADGWWLRSDIVWSKPNPMPESVEDRPTRAHEYVFLLAKAERYFFDQEAIREPNVSAEQLAHNLRYAKPYRAYDERGGPNGTGQPGNENHRGIHARPGGIGRNRRSVWTIATEPTPDAHFATFPRKLVEPCVLAGTSARGCCPACGSPWARVVEKVKARPLDYDYAGKWSQTDPQSSGRRMLANTHARRQQGFDHDNPFPPSATVGWAPTCRCEAGEPVPCLVLDPFAGAGTTLLVAAQLGRKSIGVELNPEYCALAVARYRRGTQFRLGLEEA